VQANSDSREAECTLRLMHFDVTSLQDDGVSALDGPAASNDRTSGPMETSNSILPLSTCTSDGSCLGIIVHA